MPQQKDKELVHQYNLDGAIVFGFIGSFFEFEGLAHFLEALVQLTAKHSNVKALIVGGGQKEEQLRRYAAAHCDSAKVIFTGRVSHEQVQRMYSVIDVMVYPRVKNRLTDLVTPLKPLEAMAMEKTVVASDVGGLQELIKDGETGMLFRAGDTKDLFEKMDYLVVHEEKRAILGKAARQDVAASRNWADIAKQYHVLYSRLAEDRQKE